VLRYASAVYAVVVCLSDRLYVCLSQTGTVPKQINVGSQKANVKFLNFPVVRYLMKLFNSATGRY